MPSQSQKIPLSACPFGLCTSSTLFFSSKQAKRWFEPLSFFRLSLHRLTIADQAAIYLQRFYQSSLFLKHCLLFLEFLVELKQNYFAQRRFFPRPLDLNQHFDI